MPPEPRNQIAHGRTLREHLWYGFKQAHKRRSISFYMLVLMPVVLMLGLQMAELRDQPWRFAGVLTLLFLFCGVVLCLAVADIFRGIRIHLREHHAAFRDTLGDEEFFKELSDRASQQRGR